MDRCHPTQVQSQNWFITIMKERCLLFEDSQDQWTMYAGLLDAVGVLAHTIVEAGDVAGAAADVANVANQIAAHDWIGPERS